MFQYSLSCIYCTHKATLRVYGTVVAFAAQQACINTCPPVSATTPAWAQRNLQLQPAVIHVDFELAIQESTRCDSA
jgi:hypothetical protein